MKDHVQKTNAVRQLETAGIPFGLIPYQVDENNLAAEHVAEQLGEPIEQVFKTLVLLSSTSRRCSMTTSMSAPACAASRSRSPRRH